MGGSSVTDYDWVSEATTATSGELVIDATATPPFDPTQSYHFLVMHQNCPDEILTVSYEGLQPVQEDAGTGPQEDGAAGDDAGGGGGKDKGCGCRTAGAAGPLGPALVLGLLLLIVRRRRNG
jgi:MYXO-CTERM domain-containing protein